MTNKIYDKTSFLKRFVLLLMLFARVTGIWADDFTGIWYIDNNENHTGAANQRWYLVPAANPQQANAIDAYYSPNHNETNGDPAKPFLTTYKTNKDLNSVWVVAPSSTSGYYYVVHVLTGKYVIYEPPLPNDGSNQRKSMHLQNISDTGYALDDKDDYNFDFIGVVDGDVNIRPKSRTGWFWNPAGTQTNQYYGNGSPLYRNGLVGIYNNATGNSIWHFESALLAAPTISNVNEYNKVTVTENNGLPAGYNVRYTFGDGTQADPTASSAIMPTDGYEVLAAGTIKVVIERYGVVLTAVASKHVEPLGTPDDPVITLDDCTNTFTIDAGGAGIYYTTDGTEPSKTNGTHYTGPFQLSTSVTAVKAVSYFGNTRSVNVTTSAAFSPKTLMPTINVVGNRVTITSASGNIYYTLDGATPTESSTPYTSSFTLPNGTGSITIKAIAKEAGMSASCVSQQEVKLAIFISNITELNGITAADNYILTCDLDASGYTGSIDNFSGSFDGGMFTISGLTKPLFNSINGGTVKNVRLSGVSISGLANAGAVCGEADGATKIYNCGVLSGSVSGTSNAGGLVGHIRSGSSVRVVNCYNYASVSGGSYAAGIVGYNEGTVGDVRIALCMMYGSVSGATNISPVYAGNHTNNVRNFTEYNYWRSKANISYTAYNDQLAIDKDEYLTRFPFYRHILNTHRELAAFFLFGESGEDVNDIIAEEVAEIGHWVLDTEVADYPIVEDWQSNTRKVLDAPAGTTVTDEHLGTSLNVSVKINGRSYSASLPITDMDEANHDYTYGKVVLPFANEFEVNTDYTKICTGWRITHIDGGTAGTFSNYNVSDRNCTAKDLYSTTGFVFAQGGYFIVPYDVTNIEITANFANAYYLCDASYEIGYLGDGSPTGYTGRTGLGGSTPTTYHGQPVYNTLPAALNAMSASNTTHTQAVVLVGNYHMDNDNLSDKTANGYTIMSIDADNNQEPDYAIYSNNTQDRPAIPPTRFDFVAFIPMGMSSHVNGAKFYPNTPIWKSRGWFEITETGLMRADQFELESGNFNENKTNNCRCIINGGYFTQMVRSRDKACTRLSYYQIGGKAYVKEFYPGNHSAKSYENTLVPVNVTGGEIEQCFMTGYGKGTVTGSDIYFWCAGGKIHKFLGAYMENPSTAGVNMTAKIDHARIYRFFGGGTTSKARITGNINVTIDNSLVDFYCGGPEFGDMVTGENGKTVTTHATNTTFGEYYGAGFGGTAITYTNDEDESKNLTATYTYPSGFFTNHYLDAASDAGRLDYKSGYGIGNCYKFEFIIHSRGHQSVARFYTGYASFSLAKTGNVTNVLDNCTILNSFYGGGCQGTVDGTVTSTLNGCTVVHSAYGGGYKAAANEVDVYPTTSPSLSVFKAETGIFSDFGTVDPETYTWEQGTAAQNNVADATNKKLYTSTEVTMTDLGNVTGAISITVNGGTVGESVYAGGNESKSLNNTTVNIQNGTITSDVYGGGNKADVTGSVTVSMTGGTVNNVYGGGALANTNIGNATDYGTGSETISSTSTNTTTVNLKGGTIKGDAYGGGLGKLASTGASSGEGAVQAKVYGDIIVNLGDADPSVAATAFHITNYTTEGHTDVVKSGRLFGANNLNGSPQGDVTVNVYKTVYGNVHRTAEDPDNTGQPLKTGVTPSYELAAVYGGGNLANYTATGKSTYVKIWTCDVSVESVYGGGNAAEVPATDVLVNGAYEIQYVFGGGNGKDEYTLDNGSNWTTNPGANVTTNANTMLQGGFIHEAYGGSNEKGTIYGSATLNVGSGGACDLEVLKMVGAGKNADIDGDVILVLGCMPTTKTPLVFGGADNANVNGNVELTITSGTFGQIFGGNNLGGVIKGHIKVNIEETGCNPIRIDELYLGGNQAAYSVFGYYDSGETLSNGKVKYLPRTSGTDSHTAIENPSNADNKHPFPYAQPVMNVTSCTSIGSVFGGGLGSGAVMYADPTVNINMVQGAFANALPVDADNNPNKLGAVENVYGGGNEAAVYGNTKVNIGTLVNQNIVLISPENETEANRTKQVLGAFITGTVYGAGKGLASDPNAAIVTGNTQVNMAGGHVSRSIYGGGELGSVGTFTETYTTQELHPYHAVGEPKTCKKGTGLTEVKISGGQVGLVRQLMPDPSNPTSDDDYGYVFCACKGVADSVTYAKANLLAICDSSHLVISGNALIAASVYGGSENGQVLGGTYVEIKGGQIGTGYDKANSTWDDPYTDAQWTAAINAIKSGVVGDINTAVAPFHECDAWPFGPEGSRYVYDYYHGTEGYNSQGGGKPGSDGHSYYGHVFGGGSGYYPFAPGKWRRTAGRVNGNTVVEISGGHVLTNVYGGNEITDVLGSSKVEMWGGTVGVPRTIPGIQARPVNSYIFGAGMGDPRVLFNGWSNVGSAEVIVRGDAVVFGSVFGGGEDGHVLGNVSTTIKGDALIGTFGSSGVDGNIFGSGRGFSALSLTAGAVCGNVEVNIAENAKILGSVYGGGRLAAVGTYLAAEGTENYGKLITEGTDPYGTGSTTHGNVTINITGGTIGNQSQMSTSAYSIGDVFGGSKGTLLYEWSRNQKLGLVKNTTVNISQASGSTTRIYGNVYGGGEIASVGSFSYATTADNTLTEPIAVGDVNGVLEANTGKATIIITGGFIGQESLSDTKGSVFGGCLGKAGAGYSGYSFVNNSDVTLNGGTVYGCVFGGGENGHVFNNTDVKIKSGSVGLPLDKKDGPADDALVDNMIYRGNVYGGGRGIDKTTGGNYSITAGKVNGDTNVTVEGGTIYRNVYGGGSLASVGNRDEAANTSLVTETHPFPYATGLATVTIKGGQIGTDGGASANDFTTFIPTRDNRRENGFVFGSGRGMAAGNNNPELVHLAYTKNTIVKILGSAKVTGSVFGGGENGHVSDSTRVYVSGGSIGTELTVAPANATPAEAKLYEHTIDDNGRGRLLYRGNVYGGGRGIDMNESGKLSLTAGRVYGNTYVEISGGNIYHDVFGGGSLASVGNETVNTTTGEVTYSDQSGKAEVHIKGGIIGYSDTHPELMGFNCGFVYGGCRGLSADPQSEIIKMAYVHNAKVYIEPGAKVKGSVFGGGANGHVKNDTYVKISGGEVGTALKTDEVGFDDHGVANKPVFRGNVYAGGRGVDMYQKAGDESYSMTAGAVYGNAELVMTGGHVWHNVYGSGAMASVGTVQAKPAGTHVHDEIVNTGGTIVNPDGSEVNYLTGVFTDNTGKVTVTITGGTVGDTTPGHEGRNNGRVYGAGRGVSANRSDLVASMEYVKETFVTIGTKDQAPSDYSGSEPGELNYPYIYGAVFGGGENGHVKTDTHVTMHSGIIGWPLDEGATGQHKTAADGASKNPYRGHIFGGGRGVDPLYHTSTETRSSTAGRVYGHTYVTMTGGLVRRAIYGGGLLASVGMYRLAESDLHIISMIEDEVDGGDAQINISGGIIGNVMPDGSPITDASTSGYPLLAPGDNNGHVFGSSCGMVADNYVEGGVAIDQQYRQMGYSHSTHVNISGGHLFGSVFGSGENGHVWEDTRINVSGGEIGSETSTLIYCGNVYGSGRGVDHPHEHVSETAGKVRGNTTVNVTGGTVWRDVYGGGSLASVGEATEVADDSKKNITTDPLTNNPFPYSGGLTRVVIDGTSQVHGSVYGSGRGVASANEEYKQAAYVKNTLVTVKGNAHVFQNVFGGGNAGHVRKNTDVTISGQAKVDGNVYGGGAGDISSPTAGLVNHDVAVNIKGGLIAHDVYGGGAIANSNVHDVRNTAVTDCGDTNRGKAKTLVNLTGGIILGDAYGGGQGVIPGSGATAAEIANAAALVQGDVTVTLNGTAFYPTTKKDDQNNDIAASGRVFGCNNLNGTPQGTVFVKVMKTVGLTESGGTYTVNATKPTKGTDTYEVQAVYGGGNLAAYVPWDGNATGQYAGVSAANNPLQVLIDGCDEVSIEYVYGGGNAASVASSQVVVNGAYELGSVFGGGNGKDRISNDGLIYTANPGAHVGLMAYPNTAGDAYSTKAERAANYGYGTGKAHVIVYGGTVHEVYGGSNTKGNVRVEARATLEDQEQCDFNLDEAYGGGRNAEMDGDAVLEVGCIKGLGRVYGGAANADVNGDVVLNITNGTYGQVFGGNDMGGNISGSIIVNIEETGCRPIIIGELYGGGNEAAYTAPTGGNYPVVNIKSFTSIGTVFGGGYGEAAVITGNPEVNINVVTGKYRDTVVADGAMVVGSSVKNPGDSGYDASTGFSIPAHQAGTIGNIGTVFGGGNAARVVGNTNVNVGTHVDEEVYDVVTVATGASVTSYYTRSGDTYTAATGTAVDGTTYYEKKKVAVRIVGNVFGGGNKAEVTGNTNVIVGK